MPRWPLLLLGAWPFVVVPGFAMIERYANTPGRLAEPPGIWPASVSLDHPDNSSAGLRPYGTATIVMLAHPRCPCTRASLGELARLMADVDGRATAFVLFVDPVGHGWEQTDIWRQAEEIPGVRVLTDHDGVIARQFGAFTSGQTLLYDASGKLAFNGGITPARGHEGDNLGRLAITEIVNGGVAQATSSNVFGCDLQEPERAR